MAEKDISEKILEAYNDVFADIVNALLFDGEPVIDPDDLEDQAPRSYYKADGHLREIERDVAKRWKKGNIRVTCIGLENQTNADPDMSLRMMGYDGAEYRSQLLSDNEGKSRYPVVTLVLYFGHKKHWDQPLSLYERLDIPERFRPFVNDYKVNLFEIAYLTQEQLDRFKSDFRIVAEYFVQKRQKEDYTPTPQVISHVQETLQLLSVMTGDHRFEKKYDQLNAKGGTYTMCEFLDKIENRGFERGVQVGELRGEQRGIQIGEQKGLLLAQQTEENYTKLLQQLLILGRTQDLERTINDKAYRHKLMKEFSIG